MKKEKVTLEEIAARKVKVLHKIRVQHTSMSKLTQEIFSPFFPKADTDKQELGILKTFNSLVNAYDGVMFGLKIVNVLKGFLGFGRRKR